MADALCPCGRPTTRTDGYCSWTCKGRYGKPEKKKRERKPPATGSRERKKRIREMVKNYSAEDWAKALAYFDNRCAYCGSDKELQQEHFVPVRHGGGYSPDNIVPACKDCNAHKQGRDPFDWLVVKERRLRAYIKIEDYFKSL